MSIRKKLIIYITIFIALSVVLTSVSAYYYFSRNMESLYEEASLQGLEGFNTILENYKEQSMVHALFFAEHPEVVKAVEARDTAALVRILGPMAKNAGLDSVTVSDGKGVVLARTHDAKVGDSVKNQMNVQSALQGKIIAAIEPGTVVKLSVRAGAPVKNGQGQIIGVITPGYNTSRDEIVDRVKKMFDVEATMFLGDVRVATTLMKDGQRAIGTKLNSIVAEKVLNQGQKYVGHSEVLGKDYITTYLPIMGADNKPIGMIFTGKDSILIKDAQNRMLGVIALVALSVLIIGFICTVLLAKSITKPIQSLAEGAGKVADGDLTHKVEVWTQDEVGNLTESFNRMVHQLQGLVKQVGQLSQKLLSSSEQLTAGAEQTASAVEQVAISITEVAQGAETQRNAVRHTAQVVGQMAQGVKKITDGTDIANRMASQAVTSAEQGGSTIQRAVSQMARIEQTVSSSAKVVTKLGEQSQEIGQIIDTISGIAGQTNLLALNAAIEAARAGEQGRGFAVVAEEVRKLAEQSGQAAQQITGLISEIQKDTLQAVSAMQQGTQEVTAGLQAVSAAGDSFRSIVHTIQEVSSQVKVIASAIEEMAQGSVHVSEAIQKIEVVSQETMGQTQSVSAATEEQSATMEEIAASSRSLVGLASELQKAIERFKIS